MREIGNQHIRNLSYLKIESKRLIEEKAFIILQIWLRLWMNCVRLLLPVMRRVMPDVVTWTTFRHGSAAVGW